MPVEIKLNKFCKGLPPFFYSIGPFYYATIAYHVGLNAVLGLPHPGPTS